MAVELVDCIYCGIIKSVFHIRGVTECVGSIIKVW